MSYSLSESRLSHDGLRSNRLSEIPDVTVAVLEAGGWDPAVPGVNIPGMNHSRPSK